MTYVVANRMRCGFLIADPARLLHARRRLYASAIDHFRQDQAERTLGWLGLLLCLAGGFMEIDFLKWLLH
jgi:hypothetical protein